jgi:hypothetical protein
VVATTKPLPLAFELEFLHVELAFDFVDLIFVSTVVGFAPL